MQLSVPVEVPHLAPHGVVHPHDVAAAVAANVAIVDAVFVERAGTCVVKSILVESSSLRRRRRPLDANQRNLGRDSIQFKNVTNIITKNVMKNLSKSYNKKFKKSVVYTYVFPFQIGLLG